jgi:hypothetical protein
MIDSNTRSDPVEAAKTESDWSGHVFGFEVNADKLIGHLWLERGCGMAIGSAGAGDHG